MAEIFTFGGKNHGRKVDSTVQEGFAAREQTPTPPTQQEAADILAQDEAFIASQFMDKFTRYTEKVEALVLYLRALKGYIAKEDDIRLRREGLKSHTLEQLINLLVTSDENRWQTSPSFYAAIVDEVSDRARMIQDRIRERDGE